MQSTLCAYCQHPILSGAAYCPTCGAANPANPLQPTMPNAPPPAPSLAPTTRADEPPYDTYAAQYGHYASQPVSYFPETTSPDGAFSDRSLSPAPSAPPIIIQQPILPGVLKRKRDGFATASLTLGCIGIVFAILQLMVEVGAATEKTGSLSTDLATLIITLIIFSIPAILAIVFGHLARRAIKQHSGHLKGEGASIAELVLGYLSIGLPLIGLSLFTLSRL